MAYVSNKDKKFQEKKEAEAKNVTVRKDPSKSMFWKIMNLILIGLMVILPIVLVIVLIVQATK